MSYINIMDCEAINIIKEKIYIIPYVIDNDKRSVILEKIVDNEWSIISDYFDIQDFRYAVSYKLDAIINNERIYNFIFRFFNDLIGKMKNKNSIKELQQLIKTENMDIRIKEYVDSLVISELSSLLQNTKIYDILKIWQQQLPPIIITKIKVHEEIYQYEKIISNYVNKFNIYSSEYLNTLLKIVENLISYNKQLFEKEQPDICQFDKMSPNICEIIKTFTCDDYKNIVEQLYSDDIKVYTLKRILEKYKLQIKPEKIKEKKDENKIYYFIEYNYNDMKEYVKQFRKYIFKTSTTKKILQLDVSLFYLDDVLNEVISVNDENQKIITMIN